MWVAATCSPHFAGGTFTFNTTGGINTSLSSWEVLLLPAKASLMASESSRRLLATQSLLASAVTPQALANAVQCTNKVAAPDGTVTCDVGVVPSGTYVLGMVRFGSLTADSVGAVLLSSQVITVELDVTSVSPSIGSIGGGTVLTVRGARGFLWYATLRGLM